MLLEKLREYADRLELPPYYYQLRSVRYVIQLTMEGTFRELIDRRTPQEKNGPDRTAPSLVRSSGVQPLLLVDNAEYVLGLPRDKGKADRVTEQHAQFCALIQACAEATQEPCVRAVAHFLAALDTSLLPLPEDFDRTASICFTVEGSHPDDLPAVQQYWAQAVREGRIPDPDPKRSSLLSEPKQCMVCGQKLPPVRIQPVPVKGIPGGQATGMALISANADGFLSYGQSSAEVAPTCESCSWRFGNALQDLLEKDATHISVPPVVYVFWTREDVDISFGSLFSQASTTEVKAFLSAQWKGRPNAAQLGLTPFYAAPLSASGARVVVRDWIETTLANAQQQMERYFNLQRLIGFTGEELYFPLRLLVESTVSSKSQHEEPAPQVGQALLHVALQGGRLPDWLLYQAVRRLRAEGETPKKRSMFLARIALIKMVLLAEELEGNGNQLAELTQTGNQAYQCGRLLAVLAAIQRVALGKVNATIVDRYYGTASSAPASVFGRLVRGAQPHLAKMSRDKRGAYIRLEAQLRDILDALPSQFPPTLNLKDQGRFALGFYHQKASDYRAAMEANTRKKQGVAGEETEGLEDLADA